MRLVAKMLVITLLGTIIGCASRVAIPRLKPAPHSLGAAQNLAIDVIGDVAPPSTLGDAIGRILDASEGQMLPAGTSAGAVRREVGLHLNGRPFSQVDKEAADLVLEIRSTSWLYRLEELHQNVTENGKEVDKSWRAAVAALDIQVQIFKKDGRRVQVLTYRGTVKQPSDLPSRPTNPPNEWEAQNAAAVYAVNALFRDITPIWVEDDVQMDDEGNDVKRGIQLTKDREIQAAIDEFAKVIQQNPSSAAARYNLGVLFETRGDLDRADALFREALNIKSKSLYSEALERTAQVRRDLTEFQRSN
jgi:tetratricopeptide (TPR) repeat protein